MSIEIFPVHGIPEIAPGDDLTAIILRGLTASDLSLIDRDVVVVTHKVVSKAEGRIEAAADKPSIGSWPNVRRKRSFAVAEISSSPRPNTASSVPMPASIGPMFQTGTRYSCRSTPIGPLIASG